MRLGLIFGFDLEVEEDFGFDFWVHHPNFEMFVLGLG